MIGEARHPRSKFTGELRLPSENLDSPRSIRKTKLNDVVLVMQGVFFFVKFGLILIYILKVYRKKSSSILLRKIMFE